MRNLRYTGATSLALLLRNRFCLKSVQRSLFVLLAATLTAFAAGCMQNKGKASAAPLQIPAKEVPQLETLFTFLTVVPSAHDKGTLIASKEDMNDSSMSYYWFEPGKLPRDTGMDFEDGLNFEPTKLAPLIVLSDGSIIWGPLPTELNNQAGVTLALQAGLDAAIDMSYSSKFPGLDEMVFGKKHRSIRLYPATDNCFILQVKRAWRGNESDYFLLEPGQAPSKLPLPDADVVCHGYADDLSLVFFTESGQAFHLNADRAAFEPDNSLRAYGRVPEASNCAVGSEYLWVRTKAGVEGIPLHKGVQRVLLPMRDLPESEEELVSSMATDEKWQAMHQRRKDWASAQGPGIVSIRGCLAIIGGRVFVVDSFFHRILELESR